MYKRQFLGLGLAPEQLSRRAGEEGVAIIQVAENSPAAESGLKAAQDSEDGIVWGDILISLDGERVNNSESVISQLQTRSVGEEVLLGIKRGDEFLRVNVRLASRPSTNR